MYKVKESVHADVSTIVQHVNDNNYHMMSGDIITKSKRAKNNILMNVMMELSAKFTSPINDIQLAMRKAWDDKDISMVSDYDGMVCEIPEPTPVLMPKEIITQFNTEYNIFVNPSTYDYSRLTSNGGEISMTKEEYKTMLKTFVVSYNRCCKLFWNIDDGKKIYPYAKYGFNGMSELDPQIDLNNYEFERGARKILSKKLQYNNTPLEGALGLVNEYLTAMRVPTVVPKFAALGLTHDYRTITAYVLLHWMWLVKRNLRDDAKTVEEIFINIYGGQGSGKSTFFETLGNALQYFYAEADIKKLLDEREARIFANKRIVFFDEFGSKSKLSQDEITALKKMTTTTDMHLRVMRTTGHEVLTRRFSGCSATNARLGEIVKDKTGARRFYEVITDTEYSGANVIHFDFDYLDSKKVLQDNGKEAYIDLWQIVDENVEGGYLSMFPEIRDDIRKIQETYVPKSSSLLFMTSEECTYVSSVKFGTVEQFKLSADADSYQDFGIQDLYEKYQVWCKSNNLEHSKTRANFKREIEELDILTEEVNKGKNSDGSTKTVNRYYVFTGV